MLLLIYFGAVPPPGAPGHLKADFPGTIGFWYMSCDSLHCRQCTCHSSDLACHSSSSNSPGPIQQTRLPWPLEVVGEGGNPNQPPSCPQSQTAPTIHPAAARVQTQPGPTVAAPPPPVLAMLAAAQQPAAPPNQRQAIALVATSTWCSRYVDLQAWTC